MIRRRARASRWNILPAILLCWLSGSAAAQGTTAATLSVDRTRVENLISPALYGQFAEFMFQDIKGGRYAELARDRGFDDLPDGLGLPTYWERDPDIITVTLR